MYEDVSYIPGNMKHQKEARQKQGKRKTQKVTHERVSDTKSGLNSSQSV